MVDLDPDIYGSLDRETRRHYDSLVFSPDKHAWLVVLDDPAGFIGGICGLVDAEIHSKDDKVFFTVSTEEESLAVQRYVDSYDSLRFSKLLVGASEWIPSDKDSLLRKLVMFTDYSDEHP